MEKSLGDGVVKDDSDLWKSNQRWKITFSDEKMEELDNILSNGMGLLDGVQAYGILTGRK